MPTRLGLLLAGLLLPLAVAAADPTVEAAAIDNGTVRDTLLDRYTAERDDSFSYTLLRTYTDRPGFVGYALNLVSQTWRDADEVSHPEWTHKLRIIRPENATHDTALLLIGGDRRRSSPPRELEEPLYMVAELTQSIVIAIPNVPNQPMELESDGEQRYEDDLLAETWLKAKRDGDPGWIIHLAMVESAVAAMDAAQAFLASEAGGGVEIEGFVVAGGSKRGWTTWLTAAVDERVRAIVPIVIDTLNLPATMQHHWGAYGFWAPAIHDYTDRKLFGVLDSSDGRLLRTIVDPYLYRDRYRMPKMLLNSAGDQYFLPDTTRYYLDDLPGLTRLRVVPNTNHSLDRNLDAVQSALGFYVAVLHERRIPELVWEVEAEKPGVLRVTSDAEPYEVTLWQAHNPEARDFRQVEIGNAWTATPLTADGTGAYTTMVKTPESGYRAFFVEARYRLQGLPLPLTFTTEVQVVPDVLPFADKPMQ
ncbi:MAG: PhoPQ-activated protein PqaA family protein [Phycisphaerales bacterium JB038]